MDFVEFVCDQEKNLTCKGYMDVLFQKLKGSCPKDVNPEDEQRYCDHLPLDFQTFLADCVQKLENAVAMSHQNIEWDKLNDRYLSTLIIFVIDNDDLNAECSLHVSKIYFLLNSLCLEDKQFFYTEVYLKILKLLKCSDVVNGDVNLMDHFKLFLTKFVLLEDTINATISVLHGFTYYTNKTFRAITEDEGETSIGYKAFASLQVLVDNFSKNSNPKNLLFPILLTLASSLKTSVVENVSRSVQVAHQDNVRLFISKNFDKFSCKDFCLISDFLKFVCFNCNYDEHEAITKIILQVPLEIYENFMKFYFQTMTGDNLDFRKNALNLAFLLLHNPSNFQNQTKRQIQSEFFLTNIIRLLVDSNDEVSNKALQIIARASEDRRSQDTLKHIISNNHGDINKTSIMIILNKMVDPKWRKKSTNVCYVQLMCNLFMLMDELITIQNLNRLRQLCLLASPNDLKPCVLHLRNLLKIYPHKSSVVMYILSIFVKQSFHPMATSSIFVKELHNIIFSNLNLEETSSVWNIVNYLLSNNFDVVGLFERFQAMKLLKDDCVKFLLETKINEASCRTPVLKLLCIMFSFITYDDQQILEEKIKMFLTARVEYSSTDLSLIIYALNKLLEKKTLNSTGNNLHQVNGFRNMRYTLNEGFYDQSFPGECVKYVILLISSYTRLIKDDSNWEVLNNKHFQENMEYKLTLVLDEKLSHYTYLVRDVMYVNELITLKQLMLSPKNLVLLKNIVGSCSEYLQRNQKIWALCLSLYIRNSFVNKEDVYECVSTLELAIDRTNDFVKLQILYGLLDFCNVHLQYFDPLIPHLFSALYSKTPYVRFIASKILMKLICDEQLRLMDGQYFLFMGLLTDEKEIISRSTEVFINEKFAIHHHQTIAKYFVSSIIHYNLYYDHPSINLSSNDQFYLKKRIYSTNDRFSIYFRLFRHLPDVSKYNVIGQLTTEILARIVNKTLAESPIVLQILEDSLKITLLIIPLEKFSEIKDDREFYKAEIQHIEEDLLVADFKSLETKINMNDTAILKRLLTYLFKLLYGTLGQDSKICQNLLFTIIVLSKSFYVNVKRMINESSSQLKEFYQRLSGFYRETSQLFEYCLLSVNPANIAVDLEKLDVEFYIEEYQKFNLIPSKVFLGVEEI